MIHPLQQCGEGFLLRSTSGFSLGAVLLIALAASLAGCGGKEGSSNPSDLAKVRAAIVARNYGIAADLARKEVASHPKDAAAQFELARAEALSGNRGRALDALNEAIKAGLADVPQALDDPAFDVIRDDPRFSVLIGRASPSSIGSSTSTVPTAPASDGGDGVNIREGSDGTHIQAGDVKLDTKF